MLTGLTIGNFDGVHRGHRALIGTLAEWRRTRGVSNAHTVVVTFDPHPVEVVRHTPVPRLCSLEERVHLIRGCGVDEVQVVPFTPQLAHTSARAFFEQLVLRQLHTNFVAVGHDFYFGHKREGTPERLLEWCREAGIEAAMVDPVESDGAPISSTRIRQLIESGQIVAASRLLGRDYSLSGEVLHGDKRGRQLGFPTANLVPPVEGFGTRCIPAKGVYLSTATVEGKTFPSITNVGVKPTVSNSGQLVVETHLLDFEGDLYGKLLTVEFRDRLRDERRFAGLEALTQQIRADINIARTRLITT